MNTTRTLSYVGLIALLLAGCKDKQPPAPATTSSAEPTVSVATSATTPTPSATTTADTAHPRHGNGPAYSLMRAALGLDLKPEQKTKIEAAEKSLLDADGVPNEEVKLASKELQAELAAGVRIGKVDMAKVGVKVSAMEQASRPRHDRQATATTALHGTLEPAQRKALADVVRAKQAKEALEREGDPATRKARSRTTQFTRGLDLEPDQKKKIDAIATKDDALSQTKREESKKRWDDLLSAFEKDTFDASKLDLFSGKVTRAVIEADALLLAEIAPVLNIMQRSNLAEHLDRQGSGAAGPGGPGGPRKTLRERMGPRGHGGPPPVSEP